MGRTFLGQDRSTREALRAARTVVQIPLRSPWMGFIPDVVANEKLPNAMDLVLNMAVRGGSLTTPHGYAQVDPANLPLGYDGDATDFTDSSAVAYGTPATGVTTAGNDVQQPIAEIHPFQRYTAAAGQGQLEMMAITANTAANPGSRTEVGGLFRKTSGGNWAAVGFTSSDGDLAIGPNIVTGSKPRLAQITTFTDAAVYFYGVSGATFNSGNDLVQAVNESVFIWVSSTDEVMYYPNVTSGTDYTDFHSYATQLDNAALTATIGTRPGFLNFKARSCAPFAGRMAYFATQEDGGNFYGNRLRWSIIGNPFVIWPDFEVDDGTTVLNGVGAGALDLEQFATEGQRCLPNGDVLTCYSGDGIANVKRTLIEVDPFYVEYLTLDRGLVAPGAVCDLGGGIHFAVLTDGWYLVGSDGTMAERGIIREDPLTKALSRSASRGSGTDLIYKWKETFYHNLDSNALHLMKCEYQPDEKLVYITVPLVTGVEVWSYDLQNDRVFPQDLSSVGGNNQSPTAWGSVPVQTSDELTWDDASGTWDSQTDNWDATGASFGNSIPTHGDINGYVYQWDPKLTQRDGVPIQWVASIGVHHQGAPFTIKTIDLVRAEYINNSGSISFATAQVSSEMVTQVATMDLTRNSPGEHAVDLRGFRVPGTHHRVRLSGSGVVKFHSLMAQYLVEGDEWRSPEGS